MVWSAAFTSEQSSIEVEEGLNLRGEVAMRKRLSRSQLLRFTASRKIHLIGMEACGGSHFLGKALQEQGHEVGLMPPQYVKLFVKRNNNDYIDAEAIAEAVGRPTMRFVAIKSDDQLDMQSLHRVRERWVTRRTAVTNQIRGLLLERGMKVAKGRLHLEAALSVALTDAEGKLSATVRLLLAQLKLELDQLALRLEDLAVLPCTLPVFTSKSFTAISTRTPMHPNHADGPSPTKRWSSKPNQ
jgi:transposase